MHPHSKMPPKKAMTAIKGGRKNQYGEHRVIEGPKPMGHSGKGTVDGRKHP